MIQYDTEKLEIAMAEMGFNWASLGKKARVDDQTAKRIVTTGKGQPKKIKAIAKALGFEELKELVVRKRIA